MLVIIFLSFQPPRQILVKNHQTLETKRKELMAKGLPKRKPVTGVKEVILVSSGKGGVGKSTVSGKT